MRSFWLGSVSAKMSTSPTRASSALSLMLASSSPVSTVGRSMPIGLGDLAGDEPVVPGDDLELHAELRSSVDASRAHPAFGGSSSSRKPMKAIACSSSLSMIGSRSRPDGDAEHPVPLLAVLGEVPAGSPGDRHPAAAPPPASWMRSQTLSTFRSAPLVIIGRVHA